MIWAVLDTNTLVSGMGWDGPPARVIDAALEGRFILITSPALLDELADVLQRPKLAAVFPDPLSSVALVETMAAVVEPATRLDVIRKDPADNRVLEAAQEGHADYIVSGDKHLAELGVFDGMEILGPAAFLHVLVERARPSNA